jgi:hypothetical protein
MRYGRIHRQRVRPQSSYAAPRWIIDEAKGNTDQSGLPAPAPEDEVQNQQENGDGQEIEPALFRPRRLSDEKDADTIDRGPTTPRLRLRKGSRAYCRRRGGPILRRRPVVVGRYDLGCNVSGRSAPAPANRVRAIAKAMPDEEAQIILAEPGDTHRPGGRS